MAELPRGTVTFVFTDIEGSTALLKRLRDGYGDVLARHQRILRDAFGARGGIEIDTQGDSFFFAFARARDAVAAVVDAQRALAAEEWPEGEDVRVRMGLHTGEPAIGEQRYVGFGVHRAARISAAGHGGQVLLSNATRELVEDELGDGLAIRELGSFRLKDLDRPEQLFQLEVEGLRGGFPPLKAERLAEPRLLRRHRAFAAALAGVIAAAVAIPLFALGRDDSDGQSVAAAAGNSLAIFDPSSNRLVADVASGTTPTRVALGAGAAWVTNSADGTVDRIDLATRTVRQTVAVGSGPEGIAFGAGSVWVANGLDGTVTRIDPRSNVATQTIRVGNGPGGIAVGEGAVWVVSRDDRTLAKIDAESGDVLKAYPAGAGPVDVAVGAGSVWVSSEADGKVLRIDPRTGSVVQMIAVGRSPAAIAATARAIWVANAVDGTVSRIDPATSGVTATISVGEQPTGIAADAEAVWVTDSGGSLWRIDAETNEPGRSRDLGGSPAGVARGPEGVFVAVRPAAGAHRGGTVVMVNRGWPEYDPGSVDPATSIAAVLAMTNDGLTGFRRTGGREGLQIVPDLATSLPEPTDKGKTYTFTLRKGLRYSTGEPVRASDFRRAIERVIRVGEFFREYYRSIVGASSCLARPEEDCDLSRGIVANDRSGTVTFQLVQPDPELPVKLALAPSSPLPEGVPAKDAGTQPLPSTGPYRIASYVPGKQMRLVRNPYFREWSRTATPAGFPDEIVVRLGLEPDEAVAAVERGDADVVDLTIEEELVQQIETLRARFGARLHSVPAAFGVYAFLNTRARPFDDERVRRAVNLAVDRDAVVRAAGGPQVVSRSCQILPINFPGYRPYCPYRRDLSEARRLVAASGTRGLPVTLWTRESYVEWTAPLVEALRSLGYRARMKPIADFEFWSTIRDAGPRVQAGTVGWIPEFPSAGRYLTGILGGLEWLTGFADERVTGAIERAHRVQLTDPNGAGELWAAVDRLLTDRGPFVPLYDGREVVLVSERVGNYQTGAGYALLDQLWVR